MTDVKEIADQASLAIHRANCSTDEIIQLLKPLLINYVKDEKQFLALAVEFKKRREFLLSESVLLLAISEFADAGSLRAILVDVYVDQRKYHEALLEAEAIVNFKPDLPGGYTKMGQVLTQLGKFDKAEQALNQAETLGANSAWLNSLRNTLNYRRSMIKVQQELNSLIEEYRGRGSYLDEGSLVDTMINRINGNEPFLVGRFGRVEGRLLDALQQGKEIPESLTREAQVNAGITPLDDAVLSRYSDEYSKACANTDLMGLGGFEGEAALVKRHGVNTVTMNSWLSPLNLSIERDIPLAAANWLTCLEGKSVLVIHPFIESILRQYRSRNNVHSIAELLPEFALQGLLPPQTSANANPDLRWDEELLRMYTEIERHKFDVALIGCGAYGLPIGSFCKSLGKSAIVLGGGVQTLFGIIGKRWEDRYKAAKIFGPGWVRPADSETPKEASLVENACYW